MKFFYNEYIESFENNYKSTLNQSLFFLRQMQW